MANENPPRQLLLGHLWNLQDFCERCRKITHCCRPIRLLLLSRTILAKKTNLMSKIPILLLRWKKHMKKWLTSFCRIFQIRRHVVRMKITRKTECLSAPQTSNDFYSVIFWYILIILLIKKLDKTSRNQWKLSTSANTNPPTFNQLNNLLTHVFELLKLQQVLKNSWTVNVLVLLHRRKKRLTRIKIRWSSVSRYVKRSTIFLHALC